MLGRLDDELESAGCKLDAVRFRALVADTFAEMYKGTLTDEQLARDPVEQIAFCGAVRYRARRPGLPMPVILGTLQNNRKKSRGRKSG
jgi:hypothetical protein